MYDRLMIFAILLLVPGGCNGTQATVDGKESEMAYSRLTVARAAASGVTPQQCLADLASWRAKDDADEKAKVDAPNYWYQKLSTEELARLSAESLSCNTALQRINQPDDAVGMVFWERSFSGELLRRAENTIADHNLMHEYLLKKSQ